MLPRTTQNTMGSELCRGGIGSGGGANETVQLVRGEGREGRSVAAHDEWNKPRTVWPPGPNPTYRLEPREERLPARRTGRSLRVRRRCVHASVVTRRAGCNRMTNLLRRSLKCDRSSPDIPDALVVRRVQPRESRCVGKTGIVDTAVAHGVELAE